MAEQYPTGPSENQSEENYSGGDRGIGKKVLVGGAIVGAVALGAYTIHRIRKKKAEKHKNAPSSGQDYSNFQKRGIDPSAEDDEDDYEYEEVMVPNDPNAAPYDPNTYQQQQQQSYDPQYYQNQQYPHQQYPPQQYQNQQYPPQQYPNAQYPPQQGYASYPPQQGYASYPQTQQYPPY